MLVDWEVTKEITSKHTKGMFSHYALRSSISTESSLVRESEAAPHDTLRKNSAREGQNGNILHV